MTESQTAQLRHDMGLPTIKSIAYSNCKLLSPEGILMCRCSQKRADWYVDRELAEVINEDPYTIRLLFKPGGLGNFQDDFYLVERNNVCVVCGTNEDLTRHHCVPYCFRRFFPDNYKMHSSHDVLLLCRPCHERYEESANQLKKTLVKVSKPTEADKEYVRAWKSASTLVQYKDLIPLDRVIELMDRVSAVMGDDSDESIEKLAATYPPHLESEHHWEEVVRNIPDLHEFIVFWRQHFVDTMNPQFMPEHWSIDGRFHR